MSVRWLLFLTAWLFVYEVESNHQSMVSFPSSFLNNFFQEHNVFYRREDAPSAEDETQGEEETPYSHHQEEDQYKNVYFTTESSNRDVPNTVETNRPVSPPNQPTRSKPHRQPNRQNLQNNNRQNPQQNIRQGPHHFPQGPQSNRQDPQHNPQSKINNYCRQLYHSDVQASHYDYTSSGHCLDFLTKPRYLPILSVGTLTLLGYYLFISLRTTSTSTVSSSTSASAFVKGAAPISPPKTTLIKITPRPAWIQSNLYNGKPFNVNKKVPPFWTNTEDPSSILTNSLVANQEQPFIWKPDSGQFIFFDDINGKEVRTLNQVILENKAELVSTPNKTEKELVH